MIVVLHAILSNVVYYAGLKKKKIPKKVVGGLKLFYVFLKITHLYVPQINQILQVSFLTPPLFKMIVNDR